MDAESTGGNVLRVDFAQGARTAAWAPGPRGEVLRHPGSTRRLEALHGRGRPIVVATWEDGPVSEMLRGLLGVPAIERGRDFQGIPPGAIAAFVRNSPLGEMIDDDTADGTEAFLSRYGLAHQHGARFRFS